MHYTKCALSFNDQLALLKQRRLRIDDDERALRWLQRVSYYRLSAYFLPFKDGENFRLGTDFNDICRSYVFDRQLRLLVFDAIERIEVAIRTSITYEISHEYGPFGYVDSANFDRRFKSNHAGLMKKLTDELGQSSTKNETFVNHFRKKYTAEIHLPAWMATELLSFGTVSMLYKSLLPKIKHRIAAPYKIGYKHLASWLHSLNYVRNVCAHHKRLWNRQLAIRPLPLTRSKSANVSVPIRNERIYCIFVILQYMLKIVSPNSCWRDRLFKLLDQYPDVLLVPMGIPIDWKSQSVWC